MSESDGATKPEINCSTTSVEGETTKFVRAQFPNGPAPLVGCVISESRTLAIVINPEAVLSPTCSLNTRFANAQPRMFTLSSFVAKTIISASLIPALTNESLESAFPVIKRQSKDCESLIALGSGSIIATPLFSPRSAAATPRPTSPAPAIMTRIQPNEYVNWI